MLFAGDEPDYLGHAGFGLHLGFDPVAISVAFAGRFCMLADAMGGNRYVAELFSDSSATSGDLPHPVRVTIRHELPDGTVVDVVTQHAAAEDISPAEFERGCLLAARLAHRPAEFTGEPWEWGRQVLSGPQPDTGRGADCLMTLDGAVERWTVVAQGGWTVRRLVTGDALLAVVLRDGPAPELALATVPAR